MLAQRPDVLSAQHTPRAKPPQSTEKPAQHRCPQQVGTPALWDRRLQNTDLWANLEQEDDGCWTGPWAFERHQTETEKEELLSWAQGQRTSSRTAREGPAGRTGASKEMDAEASGPILVPAVDGLG